MHYYWNLLVYIISSTDSALMNTINVELYAANLIIEKLPVFPDHIAQLGPQTKQNLQYVKSIDIDRLIG